MQQPLQKGRNGSTRRPVKRPAHEAAAAREACRELVRELDAWSRDWGWPTAGNTSVAEAVVDQVWGNLSSPGEIELAPPDEIQLADDLRRWPARWRYLLAELERGGVERASAVDVIRGDAEGRGAATLERQPAA